MNIRKPALLAATLAVAVTPALTCVAPAQAAPPKISSLAAAAELSLMDQILALFPTAMADAARGILAGDFTKLYDLYTAALTLTPTEINTIFAGLQTLLGQFGGTVTPTPTPTPTTTDTATATPTATTASSSGDAVVTSAVYKGGTVILNVADTQGTVNQKVAWILNAMLAQAQGNHTGGALANILVNVAISAQ